MGKRNVVYLVVGILVSSMLSACGKDSNSNLSQTTQVSQNEIQKQSAEYLNPEMEDGSIIINMDQLSKEYPVYVNYDSNGTIVQLIGVIASDETPRVSLNTCQACNPSPKAFFLEDHGLLVCQNCGNKFEFDAVGSDGAGCNPMIIEQTLEENQIRIETSILDKYAARFNGWEGPH